jgi:hypothetical protein
MSRTRAHAVVAILAATVLLVAGCGSSGSDADAAPRCDATYAAPIEARVTDPALHEMSGIVASRRNHGIYWVHNDSGDSARIFALNEQGNLRGTFSLAGAGAVDWEDIAIGPGPKEWRPYLYLADIGDNLAVRPDVQVYRVAEPEVDPDVPSVGELRDVTRLALRYPDGPHDAESLIVDPRTGDLIIITKSAVGGAQPAYRAVAPIDPAKVTTLERYATVTTGPSLTGAITAADLDRSGDHLLVRTYGAVREVAKTSKAPASALLERSPGTVTCRPPTPPEVQGEAIAFEADGRGFVSVSEGGSPVLRRYAPAPADSSSTSAP